ncbi:MAG: preprotein translocase subunit SecG [Alphaproteobacteria bacterium CG_4_10_14_0_8_um_filter_37_21]|nr:MAG: preprotein translocase subunit SecG [Alphaproteobacteria bacterium CG_4_10_14_0_8_um_filter_37_21]
MTTILLVMHVIITLLLIGTILLQKSEGGGLGSSGGGAGNNAFSARGAANFLTHTTAVLATIFFVMCMVLKWNSNQRVAQDSTIITAENSK